MHGQSLTIKMEYPLIIVNGTKDPIPPRPSLADRIWEASPSPSVRILPFLVISMPDRAQPVKKTESHAAIRKAPSRFLVVKTLEGETIFEPLAN